MRQSVLLLLLSVCITVATGAEQQTDRPVPEWWNRQWAYRLRITVPPYDAPNAPTAAQVPGIRLQGRCLPDGSDLRIVDDAGDPVNFRVLDLQPYAASLLVMQTPANAALTGWLYFGNSNAFPIVNERANEFAPPWNPRGQIEMRTYHKKKPGHPKTLDELLAMIKEAGAPEAVSLVRRIGFGYNPNGESDHYISVFDGDLRIGEANEYEFAAYADDACWVLLDGKMHVDWPGPREPNFDVAEGRHFKVRLEPGIHRLQFYHEEGEGAQLAFMRWRPPGALGVDEISRHQWAPIRTGYVDLRQSRDKPIVAEFSTRTRSTYWIPDTEHQIDWVAFFDQSQSLAGKIVHRRLETDDGTVRTGAWERAEHIFFANGARTVRWTVTDDAGNSDTAVGHVRLWQVNADVTDDLPRERDPLEALAGRKGSIPAHVYYLDFLSKSPPYRPDRMLVEDLVGYARFWDAFDDAAKVMSALSVLAAKEPKCLQEDWFATIGARAALSSGIEIDLVEPLLKRLAESAKDPIEGAGRRLQHAYLLAWAKGDLETALAAVRKVRQELWARPGRAGSEAVVRRSWTVEGDVLVLMKKYDEARQALERAEKIPSRHLGQAEKIAKKGSYPFGVEDYLSRDMNEQAVDLIEEWEDAMPMSKIEGLSYFLRGKALYLTKPSDLAVRYLDTAEAINPHAVHAPEAAWLKANCLFKQDKIEQAALEFLRIRDDFTRSKYLKRVNEKIEQCKKRLDEKVPPPKKDQATQ